jgi:phosphoglycolate phosphatase-like HAD superfamily hydrolase
MFAVLPAHTARGHMDVYVFDGDDTLWMNEWQYSAAFAEFFNHLYVTFGSRMPNFTYVQGRYFEIDKDLFKTWGVRRGRVGKGMAQVYEEVCVYIENKYGEDLRSTAHLEQIARIADSPFAYKALRWIPGVSELLTTLRDKGHRICFLSSYDKVTFRGRAAFLHLHDVFSEQHVHITEFKKVKEDFVLASGWSPQAEREFDRWFAVGNGPSDFLPALEISDRWRGVYIPHGSTSQFFDQTGAVGFMPPPLENPRVTTLKSLLELSKLARAA